ncbi:MAG: hypothetical protein ACNA7E_03880 [Wenzhouxiangellaceae bacterium]
MKPAIDSTNRWRIIHLLVLAAFLHGPATVAVEPVATPAGPGALAPGLIHDPGQNTTVLTWIQSIEQGHELLLAEFDGRRFGPARRIAAGPEWFANWADTPGLHIAEDGSWLAHWLEKSGPSTYAYDIRLARSTDRGKTWQELPSPHRDGTPTEHGFVSHYKDADGTGLVWLDGRETQDAGGEEAHGHAGAMTLRTTVVDRHGRVGESLLLDERVCDCCQTASANTALGPIVVYRDRDENEIRDISIVRRIDGQWLPPRPVHRDGWNIAGCPVNGPDVIARDMRVAVAWFTMAGGIPVVRVAVSMDAGESFSEPVDFSAGKALGRVQLLELDEGFALGWMEQNDGQAQLRLAHFDDDGDLRQQQPVTTLEGNRISGFPRLARAGDRILAVWTTPLSDPDRPGRTTLAAALLNPESGPNEQPE